MSQSFFACSKHYIHNFYIRLYSYVKFHEPSLHIFGVIPGLEAKNNGMLSMSDHKTILEDEKYECLTVTRIIVWLFLDTQYQTYLCKIYIKTLSKWSFGG